MQPETFVFMKNSFVLAQKDFASYFHSWIGICLFAFFLMIAGLFFSLLVFSYAQLSADAARQAYQGVEGISLTRFVFGSFFMNLSIILMFIVPVISMRAFAEERKFQTLELLFTYPFSDFEIVWGKFLGLVWFFEILFLPTALFTGVIYALGGRLDVGPVAVGYLGLWLLGNAYLSFGLFVSSISENQVVSAVTTFGCLIFFWLLDWVAGLTDGFWAHFFSAVSPLRHYREFALGILDLSNVAYFCFFHLYFLFLTLRAVEARNWRG